MSGRIETNITEETNEYYIYMFSKSYILYMVVLSGICLLGITGNGLVIWFVAFRMKKTVNSVWFLSLAFADFIFCLFLPLSITYLALGYNWPFGTFMCKLRYLVLYLNLSASVIQLTIISIDRCISVVFPVWCRNHRTVRLAVKVVLAIWILCFLLNVSYFIFAHVSVHHTSSLVCFKDWSVHSVQVIIRFIVLFVVPFTIIIVCYTVIFMRIRKNHRTTSTKPFKVIAAVIISFFICWFPHHVFSIMDSYVSYTLYDNLRLGIFIGKCISVTLAYSNSCVNLLLYVFIGQHFKEKFWSAIKSAFERTFTEEANLTDPNRNTFVPDHAISQM